MNNCPYCDSKGKHYFKVFSRIFNRCQKCDLIYYEILENYESVLSPYREGYFVDFPDEQLSGKRDRVYCHTLDLIEKRKQIGRLLDVGTGVGFFLLAAQKRGWDVEGIEPSMQSVDVAKRQNSLNVFNGTLQEYEKDMPFDAITFVNVLDHSAEPWKELDKVNYLLKPGGIVYIRFPNGFLHAKIYRLAHKCGLAKLFHKFLVFHQYAFTPKFIKRLLSDWGFSRITVINSPPSEGDPYNILFTKSFANFVKCLLYIISKFIETITSERILMGASLEVVATKE